jgi:hypothetical protein
MSRIHLGSRRAKSAVLSSGRIRPGIESTMAANELAIEIIEARPGFGGAAMECGAMRLAWRSLLMYSSAGRSTADGTKAVRRMRRDSAPEEVAAGDQQSGSTVGSAVDARVSVHGVFPTAQGSRYRH